MEIVPNAFGEKSFLGSLCSPACGFVAMTRPAERWRAIKVSDSERRQVIQKFSDLTAYVE